MRRCTCMIILIVIATPALAGVEKAKSRLKDLQLRVVKQEFLNDSLRYDMLTFCREQVGTPFYPHAIEALSRIPNPFDRLDAGTIDEEDRKLLSIREMVGYIRTNNRAIAHLAISFDSNFLATSGWDNVVHVFKLGGNEPISWAKLDGSPSGIAFTPDGRTLAAGCGDTRVLWWDLSGEKAKQKFAPSGHKVRPFSVAFSPNGKMFASGSLDPVLRLWKLDDPEPEAWAALANERTPSLGISSLAFSHNGKYLIAGSHLGKETLRVWDAAGNFLDEKTVPPTQARLVTCSPTEPVFAFVGDEPAIHLWRIEGGKFEKLRKLTGHTGKALPPLVKALAFSPNGKVLASSGQDKRVRLWDVASGEILREWHFLDEARALAFASDGRHLAVGNSDGTLYVLRLEANRFKAE